VATDEHGSTKIEDNELKLALSVFICGQIFFNGAPLARILRIELGNPLRDQLPDLIEGDGTAFVSVLDPTVNSG
jgi:hypothetical protein